MSFHSREISTTIIDLVRLRPIHHERTTKKTLQQFTDNTEKFFKKRAIRNKKERIVPFVPLRRRKCDTMGTHAGSASVSVSSLERTGTNWIIWERPSVVVVVIEGGWVWCGWECLVVFWREAVCEGLLLRCSRRYEWRVVEFWVCFVCSSGCPLICFFFCRKVVQQAELLTLEMRGNKLELKSNWNSFWKINLQRLKKGQ